MALRPAEEPPWWASQLSFWCRVRHLGHVERTPILLSGVLCAFSAYCYGVRPDAQAAFTIWPSWMWMLLGVALVARSLRRGPRRAAVFVAAGWLAYTVAFTDEARSLLRLGLGGIERYPASDVIRVVSVNCCGGDTTLVHEALAWHPDVVLLQEPPTAGQLRQVEARGTVPMRVALGPNGAILALGAVALCGVPSDHFTRARVRLPSGLAIDAVSLRLSTPAVRADIWSRDYWRSYAMHRRTQRAELREAVETLGPLEGAVIVGGDFNAPQGDGALTAMPHGLRDAFADAGCGWGNTILNRFPVLRIDQIWVSSAFEPQRVVAQRTERSDHRLVICDLRLRP